jgi:hypothetical protein
LQEWYKRRGRREREDNYFDEEVKMAAVIIIANGGVATDDHFAINLSRKGYMLSNGKAKNILYVREFETIPEINE